jgi:muramidase (phage lysozyme)
VRDGALLVIHDLGHSIEAAIFAGGKEIARVKLDPFAALANGQDLIAAGALHIRRKENAFAMTRLSELSPNEAAFLDMLAKSEGTAGLGDDGYNVLVGGGLFDSYGDHPRRLVHLRPGLASTAAGRYQILARTYDDLSARLRLYDFSPETQDRMARALIDGRGALTDVVAGRFAIAVEKCRNIWASLPGNDYQQHQNSLDHLREAYVAAGGSFA